jgi:hypothetical protein
MTAPQTHPESPPPPKAKMSNTKIGCIIATVLGIAAVLAVLITILVPAVGVGYQMANRASCANNLSQIGKAEQAYAAAHKQAWPKVVTAKDASWNEIGNTRHDRVKAFCKPATGVVTPKDEPENRPQSNTANLWVLVSAGYLKPAAFICPSSDDRCDDTVTNFTAVRDFRGPEYVSYSFQNNWGQYLLTSTASTNARAFAVAADANPQRLLSKGLETVLFHGPWRSQKIKGNWELNSPNHTFIGQNVLYLDGHIAWTDNPWCGVNYDNIWVMRKKDGDSNPDLEKVDSLRSWDDPTSYDGKRTLPADSMDDSFLVP